MGKSYVENSLKRFLKRKVKITLGLVVTFMITGVVSFGIEEGSTEWHKQQAKKYLTGYTKNNTFNAITGGNFSIDENGVITINELKTEKIENILLFLYQTF